MKFNPEGNVNFQPVEGDVQNNDNASINNGSNKPTKSPSLVTIHGALIIAQILFGGGAIVAALGLPATNPVLFALIREGIAGPMLVVYAYFKDKLIPKLSDWKLFIGPGICLFLNQLCFIVGLKISSGITASAWQPSQGILAVIYGYCFGIERGFDKYKISGILIGTSGAIFMITFNNHDTSGNSDFFHQFGGSIMLFINCSATVMYLILGKPVFKKYPSATITGYSYIIASFSMVIAQLVVAYGPDALLKGVCPDCDGDAWHVPPITIIALIYWIICESIIAYLVITWANRYADPSVNLAYTVLQPLTSVVGSEILLWASIVPLCHVNSSHNKDNCLYAASWNDLGAIGIVIGLYFVIYSQRLQRKNIQNNQNQNQADNYLPINSNPIYNSN